MSATCPECGVTFPGGQRGGHCRGGAYGGCCQTFSSDGAFDHHRVGPQSARSCLDVTVDAGWRSTSRGWTDSEPMPADVLQVIAP